ncbi:MAG: hypothetical protein R3C45_05540 [Phycisphaerales bacterium]
MTAGQTPNDTALAGWGRSEYGYNAYFLGSYLGLRWKNNSTVKGNLTFIATTNPDTSDYRYTPRISEVLKTSETITLGDSRNYRLEATVRQRRRQPDLRQSATSTPPPTRPTKPTSAAWPTLDTMTPSTCTGPTGHGGNFSVDDVDEPYGPDELDRLAPTLNDNKWDLQ